MLIKSTTNTIIIIQKATYNDNINNIMVIFFSDQAVVVTSKTGSGDPDYNPRGGWIWRVLRSSIPIQLCLVALLLAAWLVERPRCCDALNSLAQTLTPKGENREKLFLAPKKSQSYYDNKILKSQ